jgi:O-antigen ligase
MMVLLMLVISYEFILLNMFDLLHAAGLGKFFRFETIEGGSGRLVAWQEAWRHIQRNFYLGKGFYYDEYLFNLPRIAFKLSRAGHQGGVHNVFLTFWLNTGLFGLILYFGGLIVTVIRASKWSRLAVPVLFAALFLANFESWLVASLNPFTIQLFIILTILAYCHPAETADHAKTKAEDELEALDADLGPIGPAR